MTSPEMLAHAERQRQLYLEARAAQQAGVAAESPQARDITERMAAHRAEFVAAMTGEYDVDKSRRLIANFDRNKSAEVRAKMSGLKLIVRYSTLVATINGKPRQAPGSASTVQEWMAAALREDTT